MRLAPRIVPLTCVGALLLAANARPDGRQPEKLESTSAPPTERETDRDCSALREEGSTQDSARVEQKKKRGLFRSWLHMAAEAQAKQPDWLSPLATTSGRLKQEFRYDI